VAAALACEVTPSLGRLVCCHRAEVTVTLSRVNVHFALAELPLAIRVAGLDRDPGWIPVSGRSVGFHFT